MIHKYYRSFTPICDICGERLPGEDSFMDAVRSKKQAGWRSRKDENGEWEDMCPECQDAERHGRLEDRL